MTGKQIQVGDTAEAYVHYRLLSWGYSCHYASGLTSSFDLFVDYKGKIIRIQVKGTSYINTKGYEDTFQFGIKKSSRKGGQVTYDDHDFDVLALVGLPHERAWFQGNSKTKTVNISCKKFTDFNERKTWERCLDEAIDAQS